MHSIRSPVYKQSSCALRVPSQGVRLRCTARPAEPEPNDVGVQQKPPSLSEGTPLSSAISRSLTELSKGNNRVSNSSNLLLVGESEEMWRRLDNKVNKYPIQRSFTAIGTGGQDFRKAMVAAVESVVGSVHTECISERQSSGRNYISVTVGPVWVENGDQIIQVYANMKSDSRARWII